MVIEFSELINLKLLWVLSPITTALAWSMVIRQMFGTYNS